MPLEYRTPNIIEDIDPAKTLVEKKGFEDLQFGLTIPKLNGVAAIAQGNVVASIAGARHGETKLRPPQFASRKQRDGTEIFRIESVPCNVIEWDVHLLARPVWQTRDICGWKACCSSDVAKQIFRSFKGQLDRSGNQLIPQDVHERVFYGGEWEVIVDPQPSHTRFVEHTRNHEFQHVADHHYCSEAILRPLIDWHDDLCDIGIRFQTTKGTDARASIESGKKSEYTKYAADAKRLTIYWEEALEKSGKSFHKSANGCLPTGKLTVLDDFRLLLFEFKPVRCAPPIDNPLRTAPHAYPQLETREILSGRPITEWHQNDPNGDRSIKYLLDKPINSIVDLMNGNSDDGSDSEDQAKSPFDDDFGT